MKILVFNVGSSSLKFGVFDLAQPDSRIFKGEFEQFGGSGCALHYRCGGEQNTEQSRPATATDLASAARLVPALLQEFGCADFAAIGHRVVHGGDKFRSATLLDDKVIAQIAEGSNLAPLHNPPALDLISRSRQLWPTLPQVAVFDTAFHQTMPTYAHTYAIPKLWRDKGVRRYGFHGTSHHYVALKAAQALQQPLSALRLISCHLGNGASVCAIDHGQSVDTSMGMTPLEGLVMGSRSGDVDPGLFAYLARELTLDASAIEQQLNSHSGLQALAGTADMRVIEQHAIAGDADAQLALQLYAYRVRKYIGAYAAAMGGVDALIFTGGIGENSATLRRRICERLEFMGLALDDAPNQAPALADFAVAAVQADSSQVKILVTRTNEQYMIAREVQLLLSKQPLADTNPISEPKAAQTQISEHSKTAESSAITSNAVHQIAIPIAVSARHVHLSQAAVDILFGNGHQLTLDHALSQPDGWAAVETVALIGPKGQFDKVRVLGPTREMTQIEVSRTDTFTLGLDAPLRASGQLQNTPTITLRGPAGALVTNGLIVAARHIHMSTADATQLRLADGEYVDINVSSGERALTFTHCLVRVKTSFVTEMHIDTDEANAAGINCHTTGELLTTTDRAVGKIHL
jgi:acetate kinase